MKTLVTLILSLLSAYLIQAQEVIELNEARVVSSPIFSELSGDQNSFSIQIEDAYAGDFEQAPLRFLEQHVPMKKFITFVKDRNYNGYVLTLRSKKGHLTADFNEDGRLLSTAYKFTNVTLPYDVIQQIYLDNKGWSLVGSSFHGKSRVGKSAESTYSLVLQKGKEKRKIRIPVTEAAHTGIAHLH